VKVVATNALTGVTYAQLVDVTDALGNVTLSLPGPVAVDFELTPSATDTHMPTQVFGAISINQPTNYGQVRIPPAVFVSGTVVGPGGPVNGADLDFYDASNHKLFTPHDHTNAAGSFTVRVPPGTYRVTAQPPVATGLACGEIASIPITATTTMPAINVLPGVLLSGHILGPAGAEANGELRAFNPATSAQLILNGNHTDATGAFGTVIPAGTWRIEARAAQGSPGQTTTFENFALAAPTVHDFTLPAKALIVNVTNFTELTVAPYGFLPISLFIATPTQNPVSTIVEVLVQYASGAETPVFPPGPITLPPGISLTLGPIMMPVPTVPATELDQPLRYMARFRSAATNAVLDEAYVTFVVR
jgi:hypothetical protein